MKIFPNAKIRHIVLMLIASILVTAMLPQFTSCESRRQQKFMRERMNIDSIAGTFTSLESLKQLLQTTREKKNTIADIIVQRHIGNQQRQENLLSQALQTHTNCLRLSRAIGDTLEWIQSLNQIGTDYRWMGAPDIAQEYHSVALSLCNECHDANYYTKKNRAMSLNGMGNIYLVTGNYDLADSLLKLALKEEQQLNSPLGMAINYANLGSVYESRGQKSKAWAYYRKSMYYNRKINNIIGLSICHTKFGSLYEKEGKHDQAMQEYRTAYELIKNSPNQLFTIPPLVAMAKANIRDAQWPDALRNMSMVREISQKTHSHQHLADIYHLYYEYYKRRGDDHNALLYLEKADAQHDSLAQMAEVKRIQSSSNNIDNKRQIKKMSETQEALQQERSTRRVGFTIFAILIEILLATVVILLYSQKLRKQTMRGMQQVAEMRQRFSTNITHEFRTPLTVIIGLTQDLQNDPHTPNSAKSKAKIIERQGNALLTLINQLLNISKIQSSADNADWRHGNVTMYIGMIAETFQNMAERKGLRFQYVKLDNIEMDFVPDYITKILNNLLSNALKFTPAPGTITLTIRRDNDNLIIRVSDTGQGIPHASIPNIFQPFFQAESDIKELGSGIGLSLVKHIVDALKGTITVKSAVGKGSTFRVCLPIHNDCTLSPEDQPVFTSLQQETDGDAPADTTNNDNRPRLLIIEDNNDIASYIGSIFADHYDLSYATDGKEGLRKALESVPDLIITDWMMQGIDGVELCHQVRANTIINHIPIIMVTAKISPEERLEGIKAGADAYLVKPFNSEELRTCVSNLLQGRQRLLKRFSETYGEIKDKNVEASSPQATANLKFLHKVTDAIYLLIGKHKDVNVTTLASTMCMSNSQFYRKMVAVTGMTPTSFIQRARIKKAQNLIDSKPGISLADVADQCGFEAYPNFVRSFKNVCGVTPTDYKRGLRSNM